LGHPIPGDVSEAASVGGLACVRLTAFRPQALRYAPARVQSGKRTDNRPELEKAMAVARRHKAKLILAKLDRLSRNVAFSCGDGEVLVSLMCAAGAPNGSKCGARVAVTGLCMRK
jgi:hypothetical protein